MEHHPIRRHFFYSQHHPSKPPSASQHLLPLATPPWLCCSPQILCCLLLLPSATPRCLGSIYSSSCWVPPLPHPRGRRREAPQRPAVCIKAQRHQKWGLEGREEQEEGGANSPNNQRDPISTHCLQELCFTHTHTPHVPWDSGTSSTPGGRDTAHLSHAVLLSADIYFISFNKNPCLLDFSRIL